MNGAKTTGLSEFEMIEALLKPLSRGAPGAFSLTDDAAVLPEAKPGESHVVTKDALAIGTHMLPGDPPHTMAQKSLRVNLSDLAAMGARPVGFFMALCLSDETTETFIKAFIDGLAGDVETFSVPLMGGDVIKTAGPFTVSITAVGAVDKEAVLRRNGAKPGDSLWVSGTIGDGSLGLRAIKEDLLELPEDLEAFFIDRYRLPQPRVALGQALSGVATACIDVSDGLVADVGHVCRASHVGCRITASDVPLSDAAKNVLRNQHAKLEDLLAGGDDYELVWTTPPELESTLPALAAAADVAVTRIGEMTEEREVHIVGEGGENLTVAQGGYRHI